MEYLSNLFAGNNALQLITLVIGLVLILLVVAWVFRRFMGNPTIKTARGRQPRLAVTDAANLDDKRRLVLVRRDNVEHLVMIGGATDVLLEANIVRIAPSRPVGAPQQAPKEIAPLSPQEISSTSDVSLGTVGIVGAGAIAAVATAPNAPPVREIAVEAPAQPKDITTVAEIKEAATEAALFDAPLETDSASMDAEFGMEAPSVTTPEPATPDIQLETLASPEESLIETPVEIASEPIDADIVANSEAPAIAPTDDSSPAPEKELEEQDEMQKLFDELSGEKA